MKELSIEDKELLLKDLCARLPYNVVIRCTDSDTNYKCFLTTDILNELLHNIEYYNYKPYLRPMSSMTKEEENECIGFSRTIIIPHVRNWFNFTITNPIFTDWLNKHHFDYRGLIKKGLAIKALKGMYE
jgi:hypothetical protein